MGLFAVSMYETFFHLGGFVMCLEKRYVTIHQDVQLNGIMVADATSPQVVRFLDTIYRPCQLQDFLFYLVRKRLLGEVPYPASQQIEGNFGNKDAHDDRGKRVEHRPTTAQKDGTADADSCANR